MAESASATIQRSLSPKALQRVDTIPHTEPKKLYDELVRLYGTTGFSGRFYAFRRLIRCELGDRTCSDYIHELKAIAQELQDAQRPVYDDFLISVLVEGLPSRFDAFIAGVINGLRMKTDISPDDLTNVIDALLDEEQRMKIDSDQNSTTTAFAARGNKSGITCTHCSKTGHPVERCWEKNPELKPKRFRGKKKPDGEDTASAETTPDIAAAF